MEWSELIVPLLGTLTGGAGVAGFVTLMTHRAVGRKAEAEADVQSFAVWEQQVERMNKQVSLQCDHIDKLSTAMQERNDKYLDDMRQLVEYMRKCASLERDNADMTERIAELEDFIEEHTCKLAGCDKRISNLTI